MSRKHPNLSLRLKLAQLIQVVDYYRKLGMDLDTAHKLATFKPDLSSDEQPPSHPNCRSSI